MKPALVLALLFSIISACNRLHNGTDRLSVECQVPRTSTGRYLKVMDSSGQTYDRDANKRLKAAMAVDGSSNTQNLTITNGGCVQLPDAAGVVTVVDSTERWSATLPVNASKDASPQIQTIQLQPLKDFSLSLACPAEGLFADSSLQTPESLVLGGDMGGLEFHIELYKDKQFVRRIFEKKIGQGSFLHNSEVSVGDLPEGAYTLKLYGRHVANGIDTQLALLNADRDCNLYVLHGEVKVKGVSDSSFSVVAKGANLSWRAEKFGEQLFLCRESREGKYTPAAAGSCQPQAYCQNHDHFARVDDVIAQDAGVFDYYVFARDQLGRKSPLSCQTVIVSETQPSLSVTWDAADLKPAGSILRKPYATIRAHAAVDHSLVDAKILEGNLECKVSFELRGRDELTGKSVFCTEGRCKGKTMGDYVPCDPDIGFSLVEAWEQPVVASSRLKLSVRSGDGAGHNIESEASFWINRTTWQSDILDFVEDGMSLDLSSFTVTRSGVPLGYFSAENMDNNRLARYADGSWQKFAEMKHYAGVKFGNKSDGTSVAFVYYYDQEEKFHNEFWEFSDEGAIVHKKSIQNGLRGSCEYFSVDRSGMLWCFSNSVVQYFADDRWHDLDDVEAVRPSDSESLNIQFWRVATDGRVFGMGNRYLIIHTPNKGWMRLDTKKAFGDRDLVGWVEDAKGRIWLIADRDIGAVDALYRLNANNSFTSFFAPKDLGRLISSDAYAISFPLSRLNLGFYSFDFVEETWHARPGFHDKPSAALGMLTNFLRPDARTNMGFANHGFYEDQAESLYWPLRSMGPYCCERAQRVSDSEFFYLASIQNHFRLVRQRTLSAAKFDGSIFEFQGSYSVDNWIDGDGTPVFVLADGDMIRIRNGGGETLPTKLPVTPMRVYPFASGRYCVSAYGAMLIVDRDFKVVHSFTHGDEGTFECQEDYLGRMWFYLGAKFGYRSEDGSYQVVLDLKVQQESAIAASAIRGGREIVIATKEKIRLVDAETHKGRELELPVELPIGIFEAISSHEFLVQFQVDERSFQPFVLDVNTWAFVEDKALEDLHVYTGRPQIRGDKAWFVAKDSTTFKPLILTRDEGRWQMLGTVDQFKPWADMPDPLSFAPDMSGHIWFISGYPNYEFYRYDP